MKTAVSVYSRFVAMAMAGVTPGNIGIYLDDLLAFTNTLKENFHVLDRVFQRHREVGLKLKPAKSELFTAKVIYLGHELSSEGIGLPAAYIEKICTWPTPETNRGVTRMLGVFGYYRAFLPDFAKLTTPMNSLRNSE